MPVAVPPVRVPDYTMPVTLEVQVSSESAVMAPKGNRSSCLVTGLPDISNAKLYLLE